MGKELNKRTDFEGYMDKLIGKEILKVFLNQEKTEMIISTNKGEVKVDVYGDCCSYSWIEHMSLIDNLFSEVLDVVNYDIEDVDIEYGLLQIYKTTIKTKKGDCDIEYRNESNGYYGGCLCVVDELSSPLEEFAQVTEDF